MNNEYDEIIDELNSGHPIVACMGPGTFTQAGHFIALSGVAENGEIYVNDSADDIYKRHYEKTFSLSLIRAQGRAFWAIYNADESKPVLFIMEQNAKIQLSHANDDIGSKKRLCSAGFLSVPNRPGCDSAENVIYYINHCGIYIFAFYNKKE